ncbi:uncharacterized protein EV420DRAFT_1485623 [Desarmillaria tabescens]|uniref:HNH nuclease domain-containing protein n=1 Tax=Armillaria tabescens TaxID=1929756 RepID=A0AA39JF51_ARMTA|nr:uncharacterized protein EV420DRAFT_1485623 [Desarmillaria tabescens]KAK0441458.1 hypothetical protein EV420DRAFT_1485623 [Desarmillaria tabescens]
MSLDPFPSANEVIHDHAKDPYRETRVCYRGILTPFSTSHLRFKHVSYNAIQNRCLFAGLLPQESTQVTWIIPPYFAYMPANAFPTCSPLDTRALSAEYLETNPSNALPMHKDLIPFWNDNAFSVDIDDDYRIIIFREMGSARGLLPAHIPPPPSPNTDFEMFLRCHFHSSIHANILHGDVREDYTSQEIIQLMGDLGVGDGDEEGNFAPMDDPRWQTVLGKAIWEDVMRVTMSAAGGGYDSTEEEDG